jgi:hypothetical protein
MSSCAIYAGYIYCVGGEDVGATPDNSVYYAPISGGTIGTWTSTTPYPVPVDGHSCAASTGYIYCVGGIPGTGPTVYNSVYYAPISSLGVGTWLSATSYPIAITLQSCAVSNQSTGNYLYCVGGSPTGGGIVNSIYSAPICSLPAATTTTSLSTTTSVSTTTSTSTFSTTTSSSSTATTTIFYESTSAIYNINSNYEYSTSYTQFGTTYYNNYFTFSGSGSVSCPSYIDPVISVQGSCGGSTTGCNLYGQQIGNSYECTCSASFQYDLQTTGYPQTFFYNSYYGDTYITCGYG